MGKHKRVFEGVWIPKEIWLDEKLTATEKFLLVEIKSLSTHELGCFASNAYLAKNIGKSPSHIANSISDLVKRGYLKRTIIREGEGGEIKQRFVKICDFGGVFPDLESEHPPLSKASLPPYDLQEDPLTIHSKTPYDLQEDPLTVNRKGINTKSINTNYLKEKELLSGKPDGGSKATEEAIGYLNQKANTKFKASSKKTKSQIEARLNEGFSLEDFYKVIDIKVAEWLGDEKMAKFLRPETLFGTKFEGYLNQPMPETKKATIRDLMEQGVVKLNLEEMFEK